MGVHFETKDFPQIAPSPVGGAEPLYVSLEKSPNNSVPRSTIFSTN
jgi:hypothetical protein